MIQDGDDGHRDGEDDWAVGRDHRDDDHRDGDRRDGTALGVTYFRVAGRDHRDDDDRDGDHRDGILVRVGRVAPSRGAATRRIGPRQGRNPACAACGLCILIIPSKLLDFVRIASHCHHFAV